ncbi:DUF4418 family protein [Desulfitobacterium sp.]|uniref:DUF4418 family protein n=1 Tax=Desulfitobacterium sp. TaxID=49981 RepID=UPI002B1F602B|nr:DUF4418 family protein [Desulfitobacterium sp.]MEA4902228.1 DUF4418 family protein [Desulfitobacterium sp.]
MNKFNKLNKIGGIGGLLLGLLISLIPFQLSPVCQKLVEMQNGNMSHMKCHYTGQAEVYLGILVLAVSLLLLLSKGGARRYLGLVQAVLGVIVILMPTPFGIGICMTATMACHTTAKFLYVLGALLIALGLFMGLKKDPQ